jgi:chromosome partitioning protein
LISLTFQYNIYLQEGTRGENGMILVVAGIKGDLGKTAAATNLAIMPAEGRDVPLIAADDQENASDFTQLRSEELNVAGGAERTQTVRLAEKCDDIILDTGGRDDTSQRAGLAIADWLLVPCVPRSFDVWTLERVSSLVKEMRTAKPKLEAHTLLNRADSRGEDNDEAAEVLKDTTSLKFSNLAVDTRKAFGSAAAAGLAVTELKPQDMKATAKSNLNQSNVAGGESWL